MTHHTSEVHVIKITALFKGGPTEDFVQIICTVPARFQCTVGSPFLKGRTVSFAVFLCFHRQLQCPSLL